MYCARRVHERILAANLAVGFQLEPHSVDQVQQFSDYLTSQQRYVLDDQGLVVGMKPLEAWEQRWMLNEQALVKCDASYALTRYSMVKDETNKIDRFRFRIPQLLLYQIIQDLEDEGASIEIMILKARQLGMCLDPKTLVLTADLRWISIEDIQVGQEIVSVDEDGYKGRGKGRKMRLGVVKAKREVYEPAFRLRLDNGQTLIATGQHRFLCKGRGGKSVDWKTVDKMKLGERIRHITTPWDTTETFEDGWFGGLLDGEGSLRPKSRAGSELNVSQVPGPVLDRARSYLSKRGYTYREELDTRVCDLSTKVGKRAVGKITLGRMPEIFRLLGQTRPTRLLSKEWWQGKELPGKRTGQAWARLTSIEALPAQRMIDLQTSTKTFIAEGFVSHNSTLVELLMGLRVIFGYGVNAVAASADSEKSGLMANMLFMQYDHLPVWMRPRYTAISREGDQKKLIFGTLSTSLSIQHGSKMKGGIAQGWTPTIYHISEVAMFPNAQLMIDIGLFKAVHASPGVFGVLESTGAGDRGWWPDTWRYSKANWPTRTCRLCPVFLPWFCGTDIYPTPTWIRMRPVPEAFYEHRLPPTRAHVAKAEAYVNLDPVLSRYLKGIGGRPWHMPIEQQWFWEVNHQEHKYKGIEGTWLQEAAGDDEEALQRSSESVFGAQTIQVVTDQASRHVAVYGFTGQSIEDAHQPGVDDIDYSGNPRVAVSFRSPLEETYRWELIPLVHDHAHWLGLKSKPEEYYDYANGKLFVYLRPAPGVDYSIGVDTSKGIGGDFTVISVTAVGLGGGPDVQAAEFRSRFVSHVEAYAFAIAIAAYYAKHMPATTKFREPLVAVEQLASVGDTCQLQMRKMGYRRFHDFVRYDSKRISKRKAVKQGWFTTGWSRPLLIDGFVHSVQNGWYQVNSPITIDEMEHFEVHYTARGAEKKEHAEDSYDDGIFATAISTYVAHDLESMTLRTKHKYTGRGGARELPLPDFGAIGCATISTDPKKNLMVPLSELGL